VLIQPFARKGRRTERKAKGDQADSEPGNVTAGQGQHTLSTVAPAFQAPHKPASAIENGGQKPPQKDQVNEHREALDPGDPLKMIRQKLHLDQKWRDF